jgi:hypothetical protein
MKRPLLKDSEIMLFHERGVPMNMIAEHYGVSTGAIQHRVRRILDPVGTKKKGREAYVRYKIKSILDPEETKERRLKQKIRSILGTENVR